MKDFSAELAIERIQDARTRGYMSEVYRSYVNGNYRSAVVGLWSVVVCDMLFKLDELATVHADVVAKQILDDMEAKQVSNPKSPEWEAELLKRVDRDTHLLEPGEALRLGQLHEQRHLAAHPILTSAYKLHTPSREDVQALIRSALDGLFTKPAIMSRKIFDAFVEDLAKHKDLLPSNEDLKTYIEAKYLGRVSPTVELSLFRGLWKLVFCIPAGTNALCDTNRAVNFRALQTIADRRYQEVLQAVGREQPYYSNIDSSPQVMEPLTWFLAQHHEVWPLMSSGAEVLVRNYASTSASAMVMGWFLKGGLDVNSHLNNIRDQTVAGALVLTPAAMKAAIRLGRDQGGLETAYSSGIQCFGKSQQFDIADIRFSELIAPHTKFWEESHFLEFTEVVEGNTQTWWRGRASTEHSQVRVEFERRFPGKTFPLPATQGAAETFS